MLKATFLPVLPADAKVFRCIICAAPHSRAGWCPDCRLLQRRNGELLGCVRGRFRRSPLRQQLLAALAARAAAQLPLFPALLRSRDRERAHA